MDTLNVSVSPMRSDFFFVGGTVPTDAACYVTRSADTELIDYLRRGEFCYVLNTRQLGKSSLMVRTATRLQAEGITVAVLDLTAIGNNLTPEQWYDGLLLQLATRLDKEDAMMDFWDSHERLGPLQRWRMALEQVILPCIERLVIFVDEIDAVRSLPFAADEFFGAIRECYNRRTLEPAYKKLTFCLLGVATPSDLIAEARISPFNIGRRIELADFTPAEAAPLKEGLAQAAGKRDDGRYHADALLARILHWTNGHPYMTQHLCRAIAERMTSDTVPLEGLPTPALTRWKALAQRLKSPDVALVDAVVYERFLSKAAISSDDNLAFVRNRLLYREAPDEATLAALLDLYLQVLHGKSVRYEEVNPLCSALRLSGVCHVVDRELQLRNRIYAQVFNRSWVEANLPGAELRRQQEAFRRGALRTGVIAAVILFVVGALALTAISKAYEAQQARRQADTLNRQLRQANRSLQAAVHVQQETNTRLQVALRDAGQQRHNAQEQAGMAQKAATLARQQSQLADQRRRQAELARREASLQKSVAVSQRQLAADRLSRAYVSDGMRLLANQDVGGGLAPLGEALRLDQNDSKRETMHRARIENALARMPRLVNMLSTGSPILSAEFSSDGARFVTATESGVVRVWNATTFQPLSPEMRHSAAVVCVQFSPNGERLATGCRNGTMRLWDARTGRPLSPIQYTDGDIRNLHWSQDGRRIAAAATNEMAVWDGFTGKDISWSAMVDGNLQDVAFNPNGSRLAIACAQYICSCFDTETALNSTTFDQDYTAYTAQFSRDGKRVLLGGGTGWKLYDSVSGQLITVADPRNADELRAHFSPDETRVVATYTDQTVRIYDTRSAEALIPPIRHSATIRDARFSPDGTQILTWCDDGVARVWDAFTGEPVSPPLRHAGAITVAQFDSTGQRLLTVGRDGLARLWDLTPNASHPLLAIHDDATHREITRDGTRAITFKQVQEDIRSVQVHDLQTGHLLLYDGSDATPIHGFLWNRDQSELLLWNRQARSIRCFPMRDGRQSPLRLPEDLNVFNFSPDLQFLINQSRDGNTTVYDMRQGRALGRSFPALPPLPFSTCIWFPDGRHVLCIAPDGVVWQRDVFTGSARPVISEQLHEVVEMAVDANARYCFIRFQDGRIRFFRLRKDGALVPVCTVPASYHCRNAVVRFDSGSPRAILNDAIFGVYWIVNLRDGHIRKSSINGVLPDTMEETFAVVDNLLQRHGAYQHVIYNPHRDLHVYALSHDGNLLACEGEDSLTRVCDAHSGAPLTPPLPHAGTLKSMAFSPDNTRLATLTDLGTAQVWDAHTGEPILLPIPSDDVNIDNPFVAFSADGQRLCISGRNLEIWDMRTSHRPTPDLVALTHLLSGQRIDPRFGVTTNETQEMTATFADLSTRYPAEFHPRLGAQALEWLATVQQRQREKQEPQQVREEQQARNDVTARRWEQAIALLNRLLSRQSASPSEELLAMRARACAQTGRWEQALQDYTVLLKAHPNDTVAWLEQALTFTAMGRESNAEESFRQAEASGGLLAASRVDVVSSPVDENTHRRCEALIADCTQLLNWRVAPAACYRARALTNAMLGNWKAAERDWSEAERRLPDRTALRYARLYAVGKQEEWRTLLAEAEALPATMDVLRLRHLRVVACMQQRRDTEALAEENRLLADEPQNRDVQNRYWKTLRRLGRYREAARIFAHLHANTPVSFPQLSQTACIGMMYLADNDITDYQTRAEDMLSKFAYVGERSHRQLLATLGALGPTSSVHREAWRRVAQANALSGHSSDITTLGEMLYWQGDWNGVIRTMQSALSRNAHAADPQLCIPLAGAYYHVGKPALAHQWLERGRAHLRRLLPTDYHGADDWDTLALILLDQEANRLASQLNQ